MNANGLYSGLDGGAVNGVYNGVNSGVGNGAVSNETLAQKRPILKGLVLNLDASVNASYPGTGTTWIDLTNNSNGILINGPTFDTSIGGAPGLLCNNSGIIVPHVAAHLNPVSTISVWVWSNVSFGTDRVWIVKGSSNSTYTQYWYESGGAFIFYTNLVSRGTITNSQINNGRWNNFAVTYNGTSVVTYYNGVQIASSDITTTNTNTGPLGINGDPNGTTNSLIYLASTKKYNQVLMYNRALTASEVLINYNRFKSRFNL